MHVVVDASAIAAVVFEEAEGLTIRAHLREETLLAPHLIDYELMNVALMKIRRGLGSELLIRAMLNTVRFLNIRRLQVPTEEVTTLALRTGLTGYDASYLWLALHRDAELVTLDRELARAATTLRGDPS